MLRSPEQLAAAGSDSDILDCAIPDHDVVRMGQMQCLIGRAPSGAGGRAIVASIIAGRDGSQLAQELPYIFFGAEYGRPRHRQIAVGVATSSQR